MRQSTILCVLAALTLALPARAAADAAATRQQMEELAGVIAELGQGDNAARLLGTLDTIPDDELEKVYGGTDLTPLIESLRQVGTKQARVQASITATRDRLDAARVASAANALRAPKLETNRILSAGLPDASYPDEPEFCPNHSNLNPPLPRRNDPKDVLRTTEDLNTAVQVLEEVEIVRSLAEGIWKGLSRLCDKDLVLVGFGGNLKIACIPVDIVFAAVEFVLAEAKWGIGIAQANVAMMNSCDAVVTTEELTATYERLEHVHADVEAYQADVDQRLGRMKKQSDLVLRVLLERDLQTDSGTRKDVDYTTRLTDSCNAAQKAIDDAKMLGYTLNRRAQPTLDQGRLLIATDPKGAYDLCRSAYRLATLKSTLK
jgi:hypothetical protein